MQDPQAILRTVFGYESFRGTQREIIDRVSRGGDALVVMPTGGGKSLCFQIPALMLPGLTIVISPLISLMKDQVDGLREAGVEAACLNSSMTPVEQRRVQEAAVDGRLKLLYMAPERFGFPGATAFLDALEVSLIAVDEAHCISEWGHDFRPDYRNLAALRTRFRHATMIALTATATQKVRNDIATQLSLTRAPVYISGFDRANLSYAVVPKKGAFARLLGLLGTEEGASTIVYCFSRKACEDLAEKLCAQGISATAYHAGLLPAERARRQDAFIRDEIRVVAATIAFGMGIDKPDVRLVVHYDLPKSIEGYYQETGRAGRDGLPSRCVLFYSAGDKWKHMYFVRQIVDRAEQRRVTMALDAVVDYCERKECRRTTLLRHFGDEPKGACTGCDVCVPALAELPTTTARSRTTSARITEQHAVDGDLFTRLRSLRKRLADERRVPAYIVFGDKTLQDMASTRPRDLAQMSKVFGVGEKKLAEYGRIFLAEIAAHDGVRTS